MQVIDIIEKYIQKDGDGSMIYTQKKEPILTSFYHANKSILVLEKSIMECITATVLLSDIMGSNQEVVNGDHMDSVTFLGKMYLDIESGPVKEPMYIFFAIWTTEDPARIQYMTHLIPDPNARLDYQDPCIDAIYDAFEHGHQPKLERCTNNNQWFSMIIPPHLRHGYYVEKNRKSGGLPPLLENMQGLGFKSKVHQSCYLKDMYGTKEHFQEHFEQASRNLAKTFF